MSSVRDLFAEIGIKTDFKQLIKIDSAMDDIEKGLKGMSGNLDDATKEIKGLGTTGHGSMKDIQRGSKNAETAVDKLGDEFKRTERQSSDASSSIMSNLKKVGGVIATVFAVDKIKDFFTNAVEGSASLNAMNAQFDQVFGEAMVGQAQNTVDDLAKTTGMLPNRLKPAFTQIAAFAKTTGVDTADSLKLSERALLAAADSAAFYDKSIEEVTDTLQSYLKGNYENDSALGISSTETTRNAAANKLYGKSFIKLSEAQKQLTLMDMVEEGNLLTGALGQATREADSFENQTGNLRQSWKDFTALIGQPLLNPAIKGIKKLTEFIQKIDTDAVTDKFKQFGNYLSTTFGPLLSKIDMSEVMSAVGSVGSYLKDTFGPTVSDAVGLVKGLWRAFDESGGLDLTKDALNGVKDGLMWLRDNNSVVTAAIAGIAGALATFRVVAIGAAIATGALNVAMLANPWTWVAIAIGGVIAAGVWLYKNWETVKTVAYGLWTSVKVVFKNIADWILEKITPVTRIFDTLKGVWQDFKDSITSFKMPKWMSSIGGVISKAGNAVKGAIDGSHATGLPKVPYDGYIAELHQGEAVLTAKEAQAWRRGESQGGKSDPNPSNFQARGGGGVNVGGISISVTVQGGKSDEETGQKLSKVVKKEIDAYFEQLELALG